MSVLQRPRCKSCGGRIIIVLSGTTLIAQCQKCNVSKPSRPPEGK